MLLLAIAAQLLGSAPSPLLAAMEHTNAAVDREAATEDAAILYDEGPAASIKLSKWDNDSGRVRTRNQASTEAGRGLVWQTDKVTRGVGNTYLEYTDGAHDLSDYEEGYLVFAMKVDSMPSGKVRLKMDSGWPHVSDLLIERPALGVWQTYVFPIADFVKAENSILPGYRFDLTRVLNPLVIEPISDEPWSIQLDRVYLVESAADLPGSVNLFKGDLAAGYQLGKWDDASERIVVTNTPDPSGEKSALWGIKKTSAGPGNAYLHRQAGPQSLAALAKGFVSFDLRVVAMEGAHPIRVRLDSGWPYVSDIDIEQPPHGVWQTVRIPLADFIAAENATLPGYRFDIQRVVNPLVIEPLTQEPFEIELAHVYFANVPSQPEAPPAPDEPIIMPTAPGFATREHSLKPDPRLWGADTLAQKKPLATNRWWTNLVLGDGDLPVVPHPYQVRANQQGLAVSYAALSVQPTYIISAFVPNMIFSALEPLQTRQLSSHDAFVATMRWQGAKGQFTVPIAQGSPYITAEYQGLTPVLSTIHAVLGVWPSQNSTKLKVELNNGQSWLVYSSSPMRWRHENNRLIADAPFHGVVRLAALARAGDEASLDQYRQRYVVGGQASYRVQGATAEVRFDFATRSMDAQDTTPLLLMTLPHHRDALKEPSYVMRDAYRTIKGSMSGYAGQAWVLRESLSPISWQSPRPIAADKVAAVRVALQADLGKTPVAEDPYFFGKQIAAMARLALIADELGDTKSAALLRQRMKTQLGPWLLGSNRVRLVYDTTWGGLVTSRGVDDANADFGNGFYNDHHFHYGYFIYAAAVLGLKDRAWLAAHQGPLLEMVRDYANPLSDDPYYPQTRHKDWYAGHSWAAGLFSFGDAKNQESTSEAVNAYYAIYLLGLALGQHKLSDFGAVMLASEVRTARKYWQITSDSSIYPAPFATGKAVGVLWSTKVDYATFFGNNVEFIHGIQYIPFTPVSEDLLPAKWIQESYPVVSQAFTRATPVLAEGWKGFLYMAHGILDKEAAWQEVGSLQDFDDGNTRTNALYWLATRP